VRLPGSGWRLSAGLKMPFQAAGCRRIGIEKINYGELLQGQAFVIASPNNIAAPLLRCSGVSRRYLQNTSAAC
jgi:hypothetical protein